MTISTPIDRLRAALMADEALQLELAPLTDAALFVDRAVAAAAERGFAIARDDDSHAKQRAATDALRARADRGLTATYARLEAASAVSIRAAAAS